jgi:hypothetical protein
MLTDEQVKKFQHVFHSQYGNDLDFESAKQEAEQFVHLIKQIYKPMKKYAFNKKKIS